MQLFPNILTSNLQNENDKGLWTQLLSAYYLYPTLNMQQMIIIKKKHEHNLNKNSFNIHNIICIHPWVLRSFFVTVTVKIHNKDSFLNLNWDLESIKDPHVMLCDPLWG